MCYIIIYIYKIFQIMKNNSEKQLKKAWVKPTFDKMSLENTESKTFNGTEQVLGTITNREPS